MYGGMPAYRECGAGLDGDMGDGRGSLAVEKGYRILETHKVYQYDVTQYNPESGEGGLFVDYINTFLKLKA